MANKLGAYKKKKENIDNLLERQKLLLNCIENPKNATKSLTDSLSGQKMFSNFNDENKNFVLGTILHKARINEIMSQPGHVKEGLFYCFTHISAGKIYYYSATDTELQKTPALKNLFLGFASSKLSWRTFKVQLMPTHTDDAFIPLSLPVTADSEIAKLNKPPSPRVQGVIKNIKYLKFELLIDKKEEFINELKKII